MGAFKTEAPLRKQVQLQTTRLLLREASIFDAAHLFPILSDPETMIYWSSLPHTDTSQTHNWLESMVASSQNGLTDFVMVDLASELPIGKIGVWSGNEIGFLLARSSWRKGIMSEALEVLLPHLFLTENFATIIADVDPRNAASLGILAKIGFVEIGRRQRTFEIGGIWVDSVDLELTKERWTERKRAARSGSTK